jgi:hypothetical protein
MIDGFQLLIDNCWRLRGRLRYVTRRAVLGHCNVDDVSTATAALDAAVLTFQLARVSGRQWSFSPNPFSNPRTPASLLRAMRAAIRSNLAAAVTVIHAAAVRVVDAAIRATDWAAAWVRSIGRAGVVVPVICPQRC